MRCGATSRSNLHLDRHTRPSRRRKTSRRTTQSDAANSKLQLGSRRSTTCSNGGLADRWYLDDGDSLCHPELVLPYLEASDTANVQIGAERNRQKTEVIFYVADLDAAPPGWRNQRRSPTSFRCRSSPRKCHTRSCCGTTSVCRRPALAKADDIRAMRERVQLCQDSAEFALLRESLGVSRVNHIRAHGHTATLFDEVGQRSLERLLPKFTEDSSEQTAHSADQ